MTNLYERLSDTIHKNDLLLEVVGTVVATNDPLEHGRLRVHCPGIDEPNYKVEDLPWATYVQPFGGTVSNMRRGPIPAGKDKPPMSEGSVAYGFWAIPKVGAQVLVKFLSGDPSFRLWHGHLFTLQANRSMPAGRNQSSTGMPGPTTDQDSPIEPYHSNSTLAGNNDKNFFETRGGYERQVAQAKTTKDDQEGYDQNPNLDVPSLDCQTYAWTTPGGHILSLQDSPKFCRMRLRTTTGHQLLLDDTNERIYISTARGANWIELDQDGHIHIHADESISINSQENFNLNVGGSINFQAEKGVHIKTPDNIRMEASQNIFMEAQKNLHLLTAGSAFLTAGKEAHYGSGSGTIISGSRIDLNSKKATGAGKAAPPELDIIPEHEPWNKRPAVNTKTNHGPRNKFWKA